jgi:hypothetical protein
LTNCFQLGLELKGPALELSTPGCSRTHNNTVQLVEQEGIPRPLNLVVEM